MNKRVLITGASSGIGKECAFVYAEKKYNLVLVARRKENLEIIKKEIEKKHQVTVDIIDLDLSKTDSADRLYKITKEKSLNIDVLINNAGFGINGNFAETDINKIESMLVLNMITLTKLTRLYLNNMIAQNSGNIINISSTAAFQGIPSFSTYAASKAYVLHFSEALEIELKDENVQVTTICPGATESEFAKISNTENLSIFNKAPSSRELAQFIFNSMKNDKGTAIHGFKNAFLILSQRMVPRKTVTKMAGNFMEH